MSYPDAAWERAMTVQEVLLKAVSGEWHWFKAAEILGWSPRTLRRHRRSADYGRPSCHRHRVRSSGTATRGGQCRRELRACPCVRRHRVA